MQLQRVIQVHFENLTSVLTEDFVALDEFYQTIFHLETFRIDSVFNIVVEHRLRPCPALKNVCVYLHYKHIRFGRIV